LNFLKIHTGIKTLLTASAFLALQCCSPLAVKPPAPALDQERVSALLSSFSAQESMVKTLFFSGTLTFNNRNTENAAQILMIVDAISRADAKSRADTQVCPYGRMKIEITHPWGKPLTHILIEGQRLCILDFTEKRIYRGGLKNKRLSQRIPVPLNHSILWSLARAFPATLKHQESASTAENQFTLMNNKGDRVQHFEMYSAEPFPRKVVFCKQNATIFFSDFEDDDGILYARQIRFHGPDHKIGLEIDIDRITFNAPLPIAVFSMEAPRDFTTVHLEDDDPEY
jgi:hypothetical protein